MPVTSRQLQASDVPRIPSTAKGAAWHGGPEKWNSRLAEQEQGQRVVLLVEQDTEVLAYGSLLWNSAYPPFRAASIPEVNDLVVAEGSRQRGVGTQLLRALEQTALAAGFTQIGVGVGLYDDYVRPTVVFVHPERKAGRKVRLGHGSRSPSAQAEP
jgi:GNAT superfamily N-acetyltransferase